MLCARMPWAPIRQRHQLCFSKIWIDPPRCCRCTSKIRQMWGSSCKPGVPSAGPSAAPKAGSAVAGGKKGRAPQNRPASTCSRKARAVLGTIQPLRPLLPLRLAGTTQAMLPQETMQPLQPLRLPRQPLRQPLRPQQLLRLAWRMKRLRWTLKSWRLGHRCGFCCRPVCGRWGRRG